MGARDEDTVSSLAGRLARLNKQLDHDDHQRIADKTGGVALSDIVVGLVEAIDPDKIETKASEIAGGAEPSDETRTKAREQLVGNAAKIFNGELIELLDSIRRDKEQTIDHDNLDSVVNVGWAGDSEENAKELRQEFREYLEANRDEIEALTIFYSQPHRRSKLTYHMIRDVLDKLRKDKPKLAPLRVWQAYAVLDEYKGAAPASELTALVALIRRVCGIDKTISPYAETVRRNFQTWIMNRHSGGGEKFSEDQMEWLRMIHDHIINSFHCDRDDLEMAPFNARGGLGRMHNLFGEQMDELLSEINEALAA
jgi:type I restriction enzyme, R subunit